MASVPAPHPFPSPLTALTQQIASQIALVQAYLASAGFPEPSYTTASPEAEEEAERGFKALAKAPADIKDVKTKAIEACLELAETLMGPREMLMPDNNLADMQAISRFAIYSHVPLDSSISYTDLAIKCDLYEPDLRRICRSAIANHRVFCEPKRGFVAHSAASRILVREQGMRDVLGLMMEDMWTANAKTVEAMAKWRSQEPNKTGFALANETEDTLYQFLDKNPTRGKRFAGAMSAFGGGGGNAGAAPPRLFLAEAFDWGSLPAESIVVDMGGSTGHISAQLAKAFPQLKFVVQDLPKTVEGAEAKIPEDVKDRVQLMAHDFFDDQSVKAQVYLIRYCFHNWPDHYCVKVLQRLIPVMRNGVRVVVNDHVVPEMGKLSLLAERYTRGMDMLMLTLQNARERELDDWEEMFRQADPRYKWVGAKVEEGGSGAVIEVAWEE